MSLVPGFLFLSVFRSLRDTGFVVGRTGHASSETGQTDREELSRAERRLGGDNVAVE